MHVEPSMISFDYLHSARPELVRRMADIRIPQRLHAPLLMLFGVIAFTLGAWSIESYRLRESIQLEAQYQREYDASRETLATANIYYDRIRELAALDNRVNAIVASGDEDAVRLEEVADSIPPHAWLTAISRDGTGITLNGSARDLTVLSRMLQALSRARNLRNPDLINAVRGSSAAQDAVLKYTVHVDGVRP
jgi:Tfp pilus assembly protein PilN